MKTIYFAVALFSVFSCADHTWHKSKIHPSGKQISENRNTDSYDAIAVSGSLDVHLVAGKEGKITILGDENLIPYIVTEVKNNKLEIYFKDSFSYYTNSPLIVSVPVEEISIVVATGSGDIASKTTLNTPSFEVKLSGSGDINLTIQTKKMTASLAGSGTIFASGNVDNLVTSLAGSGDIDFEKLLAKDVKATVAGSGNIKVTCKDKFDGNVAGSGSIYYYGNPKINSKYIAGSGEIIAK
jgi:hypothetical protein